MEITESMIYWITRLDYIKIAVGVLLGVIVVLFFVLFAFGGINAIDGYGADDKIRGKKLFKKSFWLLIPIFLLILPLVFVPTTKEMCAIKIIPIVANNEDVQELPNKIVELANEWVEELKPKKDEP